MPPKLFVATKAFIIRDGKILILRESSSYLEGTNAGRFDVVGGRLEPGEAFDASLLREIKEETGLAATVGKPFHVGEWRPVVRGEQWQVVGIFFECFSESGDVVLSGDHDAYEWISKEEYGEYVLIPNLEQAFAAYASR